MDRFENKRQFWRNLKAFVDLKTFWNTRILTIWLKLLAQRSNPNLGSKVLWNNVKNMGIVNMPHRLHLPLMNQIDMLKTMHTVHLTFSQETTIVHALMMFIIPSHLEMFLRGGGSCYHISV